MASLAKPSIQFKIQTPLRIQVKRDIFKALEKMQLDLPEVYRFQVEQDKIGFLQSYDWAKHQRLVVLYLSSVSTSSNESETANFTILCAVSPSKNDDTIAFESLNFLADQVRCCLWGCGDGIGFSNILKGVDLIEHTPFSLKIDLEPRLGTEAVVSQGAIEFSVTYKIEECSSYEDLHGSGIITKQGVCDA